MTHIQEKEDSFTHTHILKLTELMKLADNDVNISISDMSHIFKKIEEDKNMIKREMIDIRDIKMEFS